MKKFILTAVVMAALTAPVLARTTPDRLKKTRQPEAIPAAAFEGDAEVARRKAVALAKSLRLSGRGSFLQGLGMKALVDGDLAASKAAFQRMIDDRPDSDEGFLQLASAAEAAGDQAEAANLYSEAMVRRPDLAAFYRHRRGQVLFEAAQWGLALKDAEAGLEAAPRDPDLLRLRTKCLINLGNYAAAVNSYNAALTHGRRARTGEDDWICGKLSGQGLEAQGCPR